MPQTPDDGTRTVARRRDGEAWLRASVIYRALQLLPIALFLLMALPILPAGPVEGSRQDEWYNVVRSLRMLYEWGNPAYFIHPALFYELLAGLFASHGALLEMTGGLPGEEGYLDYFLGSPNSLLGIGRWIALLFGAASVVAVMHLARRMADERAGLLAGCAVASLPLLADLSTSIRVDTTFLFFALVAVSAICRYREHPRRDRLILAAAFIGVATSANYPGALLLLLLGLLMPRVDGGPALRTVAVALASASFLAFLLLNPHVVLDFGRFWWWFTFQARASVTVHPHAGDPSVLYYLGVIWDQGVHVVLLSILGVAAAFVSRSPAGTIAGFATGYILVFSVMQSQYERFVLPALVLLVVASAVALVQAVDSIVPRKRQRLVAAGLFGVLLVAAIPGFAADRLLHPQQRRSSVGSGEDQREVVLEYILDHLPAGSVLLFESDTIPLLQMAYDPPVAQGRFQEQLRCAFERRYPAPDRQFLKAQFIGGIVNYDIELLSSGVAYFLGSSRNRAHIQANAATLDGPAAFYEALDPCATAVFEVEGRDDTLTLYSVDARCLIAKDPVE